MMALARPTLHITSLTWKGSSEETYDGQIMSIIQIDLRLGKEGRSCFAQIPTPLPEKSHLSLPWKETSTHNPLPSFIVNATEINNLVCCAHFSVKVQQSLLRQHSETISTFSDIRQEITQEMQISYSSTGAFPSEYSLEVTSHDKYIAVALVEQKPFPSVPKPQYPSDLERTIANIKTTFSYLIESHPLDLLLVMALLSHPEIEILVFLQEKGARLPTDVAEHLSHQPSTTSSLKKLKSHLQEASPFLTPLLDPFFATEYSEEIVDYVFRSLVPEVTGRPYYLFLPIDPDRTESTPAVMYSDLN